MPGSLLLQSDLLPLGAVALGRLVLDVESPQRGFHDPFPGRTLPSTIQRQHDFHELERNSQANKAGAHLTQLVRIFTGSQEGHGTTLKAPIATTYTLCQWDAVFREACASAQTRKWLEDAIEDGRSIYFITSFRTFINPSAEERAISKAGGAVEMQVPVSAILQAQAPVAVLGNALDPAILASSMDSKRTVRSFGSRGECVYAVEYCKVKFKWYSSRKVESSSLGKNRWKIHFGVRGGEVEEDDVLEATLSGDVELRDDDQGLTLV